MVLLVPWAQAGHVFLGYPAGGIDSRITGISGMARLQPSIIVRTEDERWKMEKGNLIAYHLLESSTGAYIEWLVNEPMLSNASYKCNKPTSQVALYILGVFSFLLSGKSC